MAFARCITHSLGRAGIYQHAFSLRFFFSTSLYSFYVLFIGPLFILYWYCLKTNGRKKAKLADFAFGLFFFILKGEKLWDDQMTSWLSRKKRKGIQKKVCGIKRRVGKSVARGGGGVRSSRCILHCSWHQKRHSNDFWFCVIVSYFAHDVFIPESGRCSTSSLFMASWFHNA